MESGIPLTMKSEIQVSLKKNLEFSPWNPESKAWSPNSKTVLDSLIWGHTSCFRLDCFPARLKLELFALQDLSTNRSLGIMFETINFPRRISNEKTWKLTGITNRPELKVMFRRLATTIFSATQHYNIVAALFLMVATLLQQCYAVLRSKSSLRIVT